MSLNTAPVIQTATFEGPLSLLLYLIRKNELDIYDIPIHEITQQYLEYIQIMKELNLEVAGEFIAMAATLIYIKSRMLVPQYGEDGQETNEDPRKELVQKLLEYQKYQEAGKQLYKRPLLNRDLWLRGAKEELPEDQEEIILDEKGLFALISAFRTLMKQATQSAPHQVHQQGMSIASKLMQIKDRFKVATRIELRSLLDAKFTRMDLVVTFLSILELCRLGYTRVYQSPTETPAEFAPLYIETLKPVSSEIVHRVQEFDTVNAGQKADEIMSAAAEELNEETLRESAEAQLDQTNLSEDTEIRAVEAGELV